MKVKTFPKPSPAKIVRHILKLPTLPKAKGMINNLVKPHK